MRKLNSLSNILIALIKKDLSHRDINYLIELAQTYAFTYLKYRYKNLRKVFLADDVTVDELAIEAIAPLFERDENGIFIKLKSAFESWQPPIETEEKAHFFLNRMVGKSVEKYVYELLRDSNPFFSKILDSVNYQIEKQGYKKKQILGTTFIVKDGYIKEIGCLPDSLFLNELPPDLFYGMSCVIQKLFDHIKSNTEYVAAIPLNALVLRIKKLKAFNFNFSDRVEFASEVTIDSMLNDALKNTLEKLRGSYSDNGKLSSQEICGIEKAIRNITLDIEDGGINPGLHKYFLEQFPSLALNDYENKYQNIFENLYKFLKKEIADQLKEGI
ncbi:MAG: hypothetical protein A2W11_12145 [Ignavibacteria bacterium RBG_16_35_7]|nr:MAG: hypothetical protein A2W11_12145 [Ignavibacteria bacterium RBG_16_35_7]